MASSVSNDFMPLYSVSGVRSEEGWMFRIPNENLGNEVRVKNYIEEISAILPLANGLNPVDYIVKKTKKQFPKTASSTIKIIVSNLISLGILIDGSQQYRYFHLSTINPTPFSKHLTHKEIAQLTSNDPFIPKKGKSFKPAVQSTVTVRLSKARKSCRMFSKKPLESTAISTCLDAAYSSKKRPVPSGGGLYPLRMYVIARHTDSNIPGGYHQYDHKNGNLISYQEECDDRKLSFIFDSEEALYDAPAIIVIAANLDRHPDKYANRGYRYTLLEAGHAAQNIHLCAQEIGIASLEYGGFQDVKLATELQLPNNEFPLITIGLGKKNKKAGHRLAHSRTLANLERYVGANKPVTSVGIQPFSRHTKGLDFYLASSEFAAPNSPSGKSTSKHKDRRTAAGAASSTDLAYIKAIAEAYERYTSGMFRFDIKAAANDLSEPWLNPNDIHPLTDEQYAKMPYLDKFDPQKPMEWIIGIQHNGSKILVPADLVFYPLGKSILGRKPIIAANSSGVAAHTDLETATEKALLELIERDAIMRLWLTKKPPRRIANKALSFHHQNRSRYWAARDKKVDVLDVSHDGIGIAIVVIRSPDNSYPFMSTGAGASINSFEEAVDKARGEAEVQYAFEYYAKKKTKPLKPDKVMSVPDHARFYLHGHYSNSVEWMWRVKPTNTLPRTKQQSNLHKDYKTITVRLTAPNELLYVVRVLSPHLIPINFGVGNEYFSHSSLNIPDYTPDGIPHFFA